MGEYIKGIIASIQARPVEWTEAIRLTLIVMVGFGAFHVTIEQQTMLLAAVSGWLALIARGQVVSNTRVDQKVDERVAHREMVGTTGTANGMAPAQTTKASGVFQRPAGLVLALALLLGTMACAKSAPVLVATDDAIHDGLIKFKVQVDVLCSASKPILTVETCKEVYSALTPTLEAGVAFNRLLVNEKFKGLTELVTRLSSLMQTVQKIPVPNRGSMEANLRQALGAAVGQ